ncbi:MAG: hypothetical protein MJ001_01705 [Paludibacteraceae bacterium]|nr:hypothetical protein [Paludibacteraceae bacterium]
MTYDAWNDLIFKYYFRNTSESKVIFHITLQDLVDFAKEENVEIAKNKFAEESPDDFIRMDFVSKFWIDIKTGNGNIDDLQNKIIRLKEQAVASNNYKNLLAIVAILIMPICENDDLELHGNNYYGHLLPFLKANRFVNKDKRASNFLGAIKLDDIWNYIDLWAVENKHPFKSSLTVSENGATRYVNSLMKESLLSPSKLQKFCILFDKGGLVPRANIEDERLMSAFKTYYASIGLSQAKFKQLTKKDFKDYIVSVLRNEYDNWDGTTKIKEKDRKTGRVKEEAGNTYYPLYLQMDYNVHSNDAKFAFQLFCTDKDDFDEMYFISETGNKHFPEIYIKSDGYASRPFELENSFLSKIMADRQGCFGIYEENMKSIRGRFVVTDYYLLKLYKNKYIATNDFIKGEFYFVLVRVESLSSFESWLQSNGADTVIEGVFEGNYNLYRIEHAMEELPHRNNLTFKSEIRCKSINNLEVKTDSESDTVLLSNLMPALFQITGVDVYNDKIYAVSVNDPHRNSSELIYDHDRNVWVLKVFANVFQIKKEFQLFCNETPIPYGRTYKFSDFVLPTAFKEIKLDKWGKVSDEAFSKGLELPETVVRKNLINWSVLNMQMSNATQHTLSTAKYNERDFMLYALTSASYDISKNVITLEWLKSIKDRLTLELSEENEKEHKDKYALQNALADYFRLGYINYAYTSNGFTIAANRPTLILLTPEFHRDIIPGIHGKNIVSKKCVEKKYKCLLTGGRTIALVNEIVKLQQKCNYQVEFIDDANALMPQTIYIHADKRSSFKELAERCNLLYQDNIYANALIETLPSVVDYIEKQKADAEERDLFEVRNYRSIDYTKMAEIYPGKLETGKAISNQEVDKETFDKENDIVTFFPGTRDEVTVMITDGRMLEVDKYWGHFVGMHYAQAKVLQHNPDAAELSLPQQIRLPLLYARALTLLTGKTPESTFGSRTYSIGVNPYTFASASNPDTILSKLGQKQHNNHG